MHVGRYPNADTIGRVSVGYRPTAFSVLWLLDLQNVENDLLSRSANRVFPVSADMLPYRTIELGGPLRWMMPKRVAALRRLAICRYGRAGTYCVSNNPSTHFSLLARRPL